MKAILCKGKHCTIRRAFTRKLRHPRLASLWMHLQRSSCPNLCRLQTLAFTTWRPPTTTLQLIDLKVLRSRLSSCLALNMTSYCLKTPMKMVFMCDHCKYWIRNNLAQAWRKYKSQHFPATMAREFYPTNTRSGWESRHLTSLPTASSKVKTSLI